MKQIKFSEVAHFYKDGKILHGDFTATIQYAMRYGVKADYDVDNSRFDAQYDKVKPILKPISKLNINDFGYICASILNVEKVVVTRCNGYFAATPLEDEDSDYLTDDSEEIKRQIILNAEENNFDTVLSVSEPKKDLEELNLGYGTSDDMRYFVSIQIQSIFILELCKLGYDVFGLIKSGEAIEWDELIIKTMHV